MYVILYKTQSAFIYKTGRSIDILGSYFVFRTQIRSVEDIKRFIDILTISTLIYGIFIIIEDLTYTNIITKYSGVYIPKLVRDGQIRCHGSFTNSILSGTFATAALPLLVANYSFNKDKWYIYAGLIAILPIVFLSASGAAKLSFAAAIVFLAMWKIKQHVKTIQKGFLFFVLISALIMKAPVWFLIAKASSIVGGGGYHRAFLIDQAFKYFSEWWLCGTTYTAHWFPYVLAISPNHCDLTNQFIFEGVNGGLLTMILFIFLIIQAYQRISGGLRLGNYEFLFWCFGVSLSVHIVTVFSISYFDQSAMYFFLLLGIIGTDTFSNNFELTKTT